MQTPAFNPVPPTRTRTATAIAGAILLCLGSYSVVGEWLSAWFSYGTYSAIFTYGAVGIPAIVYLGWSKRHALGGLRNSPVQLPIGGVLLATGIVLALTSPLKDLRFAGVFLGVVGLLWIRWGAGGVRLLWQELGLFLLTIPFALVFDVTHNHFFQQLTAYGAAFMLWYTGVPALSNGTVVAVQELVGGALQTVGAITVAEKCSGTAIGFTLTYLGFLIPALLPVSFPRRLLLSIVGPVMAVFFNTARVAFLLWVQIYVGVESFHYWHEGDGRLVYSFATVFVYGLIALALIWPSLAAPPRSRPAVDISPAQE